MQKFNFIFALLVIGGATASPQPIFSLLGNAGNLLTSVVNTVGTTATNVVGTAGQLATGVVGTAGQLATGVVGTAGSLLGTAGQLATNVAGTAGQLVTGAVGTAGQLATGIVGTAGQILNVAGQLVTGVLTGALYGVNTILGGLSSIILNGIPDGLGYIKIGDNNVDVAGNFQGANGVWTNLFGPVKNVFTAIPNAVDGVVGTVSQIAGTVLPVPMKVLGWFTNQILGIVGSLTPTGTDPTTNIISNVNNMGQTTQTGIKDFITQFLPTTTTTNPSFSTAITSANAAIAPAIQAIFDGLTAASNKISTIYNDFNTEKTKIVTDAVNNVAVMLSPVIATFNKFFGDHSTCFEPFRQPIIAFGATVLTTIEKCTYLFNATDYTQFALARINAFAQNTKDAKCAFMECIIPAIISPTDATATKTAVTCLTTLSNNLVDMKPKLLAEFELIVSGFQSFMANGKAVMSQCIADAQAGAADLAKQLGDGLNKCLN